MWKEEHPCYPHKPWFSSWFRKNHTTAEIQWLYWQLAYRKEVSIKWKKLCSLKNTSVISTNLYTGLLRLWNPGNKRGKYTTMKTELSISQQFKTFSFVINWWKYTFVDVSRSYQLRSMLEKRKWTSHSSKVILKSIYVIWEILHNSSKQQTVTLSKKKQT